MLDSLQFRGSLIITLLGNIIYLVIIYNLWQAIFASSPAATVKGMTFTDTLVYLALAMTIFNFMNLFIVWDMSRQIQTGQMVSNLLKPIEFRTYLFFSSLGSVIIQFFSIFIPTFVIINIITNGAISIGINLLFFIPGLVLGLVINYFIDFFVGTICLYTESTWGINIAKEVIVLLLSGAMIPIAFFPDILRKISSFLPFQAIYNMPLRLLIENQLSATERISMISTQLIWAALFFVISGLFWKKSIKVITINGG